MAVSFFHLSDILVYALRRYLGWPGINCLQSENVQVGGFAASIFLRGGGRGGPGIPLWQTPYPSAAIQSLLPRNSQPCQRSITYSGLSPRVS